MTNQYMSELRTKANLLVWANRLMREGDYQAALALYLRVLEQSDANVELLSAIAHCYFSVALHNPDETGQNYEEAVAWMKKAIALEPDSARLHAYLAQFYELGILDYELAAREYHKAIELAPNDARILFGAASLYGPPESAVTLENVINWLERATQLEPDDPNYHVRLGQFYYEAGRTPDAEREWLRALLCPQALDPGPFRTIRIALGIDNAGGDGEEYP